MQVERTDFYSVPVQDMERAKAFYRDTLGMHSPDWDAPWPEIETGNVAAVFDGDLDQFMEGYLRWRRAESTAV